MNWRVRQAKNVSLGKWLKNQMVSKKPPIKSKRKSPSLDVRHLVLHEAGYKCGNPVCRHILTIDIHHLDYVSDGGTNVPENLLPLCPNCHALHHKGEIPKRSLKTWKVLLLSLNEAFDKKSVDMLLALDRLSLIKRITGDGVIQLASLIAAGLIEISESFEQKGGSIISSYEPEYQARLTQKGKLLVDNWKKGEQVSVS